VNGALALAFQMIDEGNNLSVFFTAVKRFHREGDFFFFYRRAGLTGIAASD